MRVVISIPELAVTNKGLERDKELYVMSFAMDGRAVCDNAMEQSTDFVGAYNETLRAVVPDAFALASQNCVYVAVSNVFHHVSVEYPVSLSGSGIILYPNIDPGGFVAMHVVVVESDAKTRNLGELMSRITGGLLFDVTKLHVVGSAMNGIISVVAAALKDNGDDILFSHNHSGFDFDYYGLGPDNAIKDFKLRNSRVEMALRVQIGGTL